MHLYEITEGLIQVPPAVFQRVMRNVTRQILWYIRDKFRGETRKKFPEHYAAFAKLVKQGGFQIPRERFDPEVKNNLFKIDLNLTGMPAQYQGRTDKEDIHVALDWLGKLIGATAVESRAAWYPKKDVLMVYLANNEGIKNFPSNRSPPDNLELELQLIASDVEHELRHGMQYMLIKHPAQTRRKPDYTAHKADYYTSPVEFDPMIGSAVHDFIMQAKLARLDPALLRAKINSYTGVKKIPSFEMFSPSPIFRHLKQIAPQRWRIAVKKFTTALAAELAQNPLPPPAPRRTRAI